MKVLFFVIVYYIVVILVSVAVAGDGNIKSFPQEILSNQPGGEYSTKLQRRSLRTLFSKNSHSSTRRKFLSLKRILDHRSHVRNVLQKKYHNEKLLFQKHSDWSSKSQNEREYLPIPVTAVSTTVPCFKMFKTSQQYSTTTALPTTMRNILTSKLDPIIYEIDIR